MAALDSLSRLDLVFCIDLTSSMHPFIAAARTEIVRILDALRAELGDGLRVAIVGYRDHCDGKRLLEKMDFTTSITTTKRTLDKLQVVGGGDYPEAVFTGLDTTRTLPWRAGAYRVAILVGDAPPHACGAAGDSHPQSDPSRLTLDDMANRLEEAGIFVHALAMGGQKIEAVLERAWQRLSISTGGSYHKAQGGGGAMAIVETVTQRFLRDIDFDRRLYTALDNGALPSLPADEDGDIPSVAEHLSKHLRVSVDEINAGLMRLRQRQLLKN